MNNLIILQKHCVFRILGIIFFMSSFYFNSFGFCPIEISVLNVECNDNGTPNDPSDDTFTASIYVSNPSNHTGNFYAWQVTPLGLINILAAVPYDIYEIGPFPISEGNVEIRVADFQSQCEVFHTIQAPPSCSNAFDCCNSDINYVIESNGICGSFDICLSETYDDCDVSDFTIDKIPSNQITQNGDCYTVTGYEPGDEVLFDVLVLMLECSVVHNCNEVYIVTDDGCDDCCAPPNINDVTVSFENNEICIPEVSCANPQYIFKIIRTCEGVQWPHTFSQPSNCLDYTFMPCCNYTIQVGYKTQDCEIWPSFNWSLGRSFTAPCCGVGDLPPCSPDNPSGDGGIGLIQSNNNTINTGKENSHKDLMVIPNPFNTAFQIQLTTEKAETYQLAIYDIQGKVVFELDGELVKGENSISIDQLGGVPSGIYYYQLNTPSNSYSDKIVKN